MSSVLTATRSSIIIMTATPHQYYRKHRRRWVNIPVAKKISPQMEEYYRIAVFDADNIPFDFFVMASFRKL
ncbi:hypothetical protein LshimejAT787_0309980 [Lyophyllum shimeji]|uniref:Uncharacterized protein n=1 Tax=Lyophyllum shimeji TaxID=47721 RepID=A0A9P3PJ43_LYOSH|nr:hypothetical protein LshimejAT787_0309980 [Lyophyllum shimeji]